MVEPNSDIFVGKWSRDVAVVLVLRRFRADFASSGETRQGQSQGQGQAEGDGEGKDEGCRVDTGAGSVQVDRRKLRKCRRDVRSIATPSGARPKLTVTSHPPAPRDVTTSRMTSRWIECPEADCSKRYRDVNALVYHRNHSHRRHLDDVTAHSTSASGKNTAAANFDDGRAAVIQDGGQVGDSRKRKCDDVTAANESRDVKCRRTSDSDDRVIETETGTKQEVTSQIDRKSELSGSTHAQTLTELLTDKDVTGHDVIAHSTSGNKIADVGAEGDNDQQRQRVDATGTADTSDKAATSSTYTDDLRLTKTHPGCLTGRQLRAAAVEYIQRESMRQVCLQMIAASHQPAVQASTHHMDTVTGQLYSNIIASTEQSEPVDMSSPRRHHSMSTQHTSFQPISPLATHN